MHISKVSIEGYRSCLETTIDLQPNLSVLIGPNSSGKTNILKAILLLRSLVEEEQTYIHRKLESTGQCKLKFWFDIDGKKAVLTSKINIFTDENNNDVIVQSAQEWYAKDFTGNSKRIHIPLWIIRDSYRFKSKNYISRVNKNLDYLMSLRKNTHLTIEFESILVKIINYLSEIRYYSASQFTNPSNCPVSFEIEKEGAYTRGIRLKGHSKFLYDIYDRWKSEDENYQQFFEIIGPAGIGLIDNLIFKEIPTSSIDYSVRSGGVIIKKNIEKILVIPQFRIGKNELTTNQLSEGTFKTITLLFYLITESSKALLLEEPEVCVHHGLLSSIIELIKTYSKEKQIIITTHSDFVLDEVNPENVYQIRNDPDIGTKALHIPKSMSKKELKALHDYLQTEGNLGEYWRHGGLES
jgi:AAA15 family ATPase/GTPase